MAKKKNKKVAKPKNKEIKGQLGIMKETACWLFGNLIDFGIVTQPFAFLQNTAGLSSS